MIKCLKLEHGIIKNKKNLKKILFRASSVYTYRHYWWHHSYPALNAIRGWGFWASTGGHGPEDVVTFETEG